MAGGRAGVRWHDVAYSCRPLGDGEISGAAELFNQFADRAPLARAISQHFAEVKLWNFAIQDQAGRWHLTEKGAAFLDGKIHVLRKVWPRDQELPEECVDEEPVYVHEVLPEDFSEKERHIHESISRQYQSISD
jgi:hypothetical protein